MNIAESLRTAILARTHSKQEIVEALKINLSSRRSWSCKINQVVAKFCAGPQCMRPADDLVRLVGRYAQPNGQV